jgi:hypothetical protein
MYSWNFHFFLIISSNLKKSNYNLCEIGELREEKEIKRVRDDYECEDEREKNKKRKKNNIYIEDLH